jgi:hypothetical protein
MTNCKDRAVRVIDGRLTYRRQDVPARRMKWGLSARWSWADGAFIAASEFLMDVPAPNRGLAGPNETT